MLKRFKSKEKNWFEIKKS